MADRRRRVVIDDDENYTSKASNKRGASTNGQSSGSLKRTMRDDDSDQDSDHQASASSRSAGLRNGADIPPEDFERLVKDVVRLAIFTSHSEQALKREDIKNVLNDHTRLFDVVIQKAQERLRDVFGMEMVELSTKGRTKNANEKGTKTYMLKNILPVDLITADVIDWGQELEDIGLLMVILSLIMVRQGAIYESALMSHFRRLLLLEDNSPFGDIHKKLDILIRKRYLEKFKLEHMDDSGEKVEMEYRWGARARIEVPEMNVVKFIQEVFGREAPLELESSIMKAAGIKAKDAA
ncbi:MAGE family-domain-containing protein [Lobosporangium transversale]|uniref:MAGE family-domain-containing protein n=1 Tax=Lobosporangium transversale TaxID=64571 RepID=A0A1Y2GBT6_9FUNG|nr:MAGE family-domain-containing protein [Lobosporangium transversale]ORZ05519.1 MAGE family-domain-containing protein [Lobosporangium transversale]|eukprot:XP_021877093.1 MAGE family-domain-containing protein [Lobosporangium transversale]